MGVNMETLRILRDARALIADEAHWTQGSWARVDRDHGGELDPDDGRATCWCVGGAVALVSGDPGIPENERPYDVALPAWSLLEQAMGSTNVIGWNDSHSHADVLRALDLAIARAESLTTAQEPSA